MTKFLAGALAAALLFAVPATQAAASDAAKPAMMGGMAKVGDLSITTAWTRQTPPAAKVAGGYMTVTNNGATADRLIGGSAEFAARVEIHEMSVTDGVMRMAELPEGLTIAPGESVELKPGSFHVMFMGVTASPKQGDTVPVTLTFANAGEVTVQMPVAAIGASSLGGKAMKGMDHGSMNHGEMKKEGDDQ